LQALAATLSPVQANQAGGANLSGALAQLANAIQSGNLVSAVQAYNAVVSLIQKAHSAIANGGSAAATKELGQALQSGNLPAAQQALSSLRPDTPRGVDNLNPIGSATLPANHTDTHLNVLA
jgi:hypothetical protein